MTARKVWIVTHFEFLGPPYWRDELISHVASTEAGALRHIREAHVDPGTWWGIQPFAVDGPPDVSSRPQVLYSRQGKALRRGYTLKQALRLGRRARARSAARFRAWKREKKKGGTKQAPSRPS